VFTARYALSPYIKQIRFFFKGLIRRDEVEFVPVHAKKAYSDSTRIALLILPSALDEDEWLTLRPCRFMPVKQPRYPLNRRLGGHQSWPGRFREQKISCPYLIVNMCVYWPAISSSNFSKSKRPPAIMNFGKHNFRLQHYSDNFGAKIS
jgi:hypothetical protein